MKRVWKTLNTKKFCFFCLQNVVKVKIESISEEDCNETPPVSLACLRRHLKLNFDGIPSSSPNEFRPSSEDLKVNVCHDCDHLVSRHSGLFQQLERIEMEMDECQKRIHFRIEQAMKDATLFAGYSKEMTRDRKTSSQLAFIDKLRTEILNKCSLATQNVPYRCIVKLSKLQEDNQSEATPENEEQCVLDIKTEEADLNEVSMNIPSPSLPNDLFEDESTNNSCPRNEGVQGNVATTSNDNKITSKTSSHTLNKRIRSSVQQMKYNSIQKLSTGKFQCQTCDKQYVTAQVARDHYKVVHLNEMWKCDICNIAAFRAPGSLRKHKKICMQFPKRQSEMQDLQKSFQFPCPTCGKRFPLVHQLTDHRKKVHPSKMLPCSQCSKVFKSKRYLKIHVDSAHLNRKWPCRYCSKEFTRPAYCTAHESICSGKSTPEGKTAMKFTRDPVTRRIPCPSCSKTFATTSNARVHYDNVHLNRKLICDICGKQFNTMQSMKEHKAVTHGGKKYLCKFCNKAYQSQHRYYEHRKSCPYKSKATAESEDKQQSSQLS